jgi:hypothetical protein
MDEEGERKSSSDFQGYEFVGLEAAPANETPRAYLLRMTGHDFPYLEGCPWEYIRTYPPMTHWWTEVIMRFYHPRIMIRKKAEGEEHEQ